MYCQNCGVLIESTTTKKCRACGQEIIRPSRGLFWQRLFLYTALVLIVSLVLLLDKPDNAGVVVQANDADWVSGEEVQSTTASIEVRQPDSKKVEPANTPEPNRLGLPDSYALPVKYGDIGPRLLAAGTIDYDRFVQIYKQSGQALDEAQLAILKEGSDEPIVIDRSNAYFLLNFLWAVGLSNQNLLLEEGPLVQYSEGDVSRFASTGGWTIGTRPASELYSSVSLTSLTTEQQAHLENVAHNVYRPCCNNHTAFADCNHGMAMLGLLELMAAQGASEDEMFEAAKYVNSFWFPQQALETSIFFQATMGLAYDDVDGRIAAGKEVFSGSGFQSVHQWLASNGLLEQAPDSGGSCGV